MPRSKNAKQKIDAQPALVAPVADAPFQYERSIKFEMDPKGRNSGVEIKVTEVDGALVFEIATLGRTGPRADMRGLFFDLDADLAGEGLTFSGDDLTNSGFGAVRNLGQGANVNGLGVFDAGVRFGAPGKSRDAITDTVFTLSNATGDLTLDVIAQMDFGVRVNGARGIPAKFGVTAPAAPDANADSYTIFEDNGPDLQSPTHAPTAIQLNLLDNDTDADGDVLTIIDVRGATNGTVTIVDGDDADDEIGDAVLYTPNADYSGADSFEYLIDDGNGGRDYARVAVNIVAVADVPTVSYEIIETDDVNSFIIRVDAAVTDLDGSEFIRDITLTATLPDGSVMAGFDTLISEAGFTPAGNDQTVTYDFLVTLPLGADSDFAINIATTAQEQSNGDTQIASTNLAVRATSQSNAVNTSLQAYDQNMWGTGDAFIATLDYDSVLNVGFDEGLSGGIGPIDTRPGGVGPGVTAHLTAGVNIETEIEVVINTSVTIEGGTVDTSVALNGNVSTFRNEVTDNLQFTTSITPDMANSSFTATTPRLDVEMSLIDFAVWTEMTFYGAAYVQLHTGATSTDIFNQQPFAEQSFELIFDLGNIIGDGFSLFHFDEDRLFFIEDTFVRNNINGTLSDALGNDLFTWVLSVPNFETVSTAANETDGILTGSNQDGFLTLTLDLDDTAASIAGVVNPLGQSVSFGNADAQVSLTANLLDLDLVNTYSLAQSHALDIGDVNGTILFENGAEVEFVFGETVDIANASAYDANGDGQIAYEILITPEATFQTATSVGISLQDELDILGLQFAANLGVYNGSVELGPAIESDRNFTNLNYEIPVDSRTFEFDLGDAQTDVMFA